MYLVRTIKEFLRERKRKISIDDEDLSAFLWITLMDAVFDIKFPFPKHLIAYADDLTVCCSDADPLRVALNVQTACNMTVKWLESIKLSINARKSNLCHFLLAEETKDSFHQPNKDHGGDTPAIKASDFSWPHSRPST